MPSESRGGRGLAFIAAVGLLGLALALLTGLSSPDRADAAAPACPGIDSYGWMGEFASEPITIPSQSHPNSIDSYDGFLWRPADLDAFPGKRPVVLIQHGHGGNACSLAWLARYLAGHGYVALTWKSPNESTSAGAFVNGVDAMRSALVYVRSAQNPELAISDNNRITLAGGSMGAVVTSLVQGDGDPGVKDAVALDNLHHWVAGDPGGAVKGCDSAPSGPVTPTVPALGFAMDHPCAALPTVNYPTLKQPGFEWWRQNEMPAMLLPMAGYTHTQVVADAGSELQKHQLAYYIDAWLRLWIEGKSSATKDLLAPTVLGRPVDQVLSSQYQAGAYLPGTVDTSDLVSWIESDHTPPQTKKVSGPRAKVTRHHERTHGVTFRFSSEQGASFRCRLDDHGWHGCSSPKRVHKLGLGRHTFKVRATDAVGNVETKPAKWKFRIVR